MPKDDKDTLTIDLRNKTQQERMDFLKDLLAARSHLYQSGFKLKIKKRKSNV
jgi:hypothetical protein